MTTIIFILIILIYLLWFYSPFLDFFIDCYGKYHIILWYNSNNGKNRKFINIVGSQ